MPHFSLIKICQVNKMVKEQKAHFDSQILNVDEYFCNVYRCYFMYLQFTDYICECQSLLENEIIKFVVFF